MTRKRDNLMFRIWVVFVAIKGTFISLKEFANDWIRTEDLFCQMWLFYQLSHNHWYGFLKLAEIKNESKKLVPWGS